MCILDLQRGESINGAGRWMMMFEGGKVVLSVKVKTVEERDVSFSTRSSLICNNNVSIRMA